MLIIVRVDGRLRRPHGRSCGRRRIVSSYATIGHVSDDTAATQRAFALVMIECMKRNRMS
jgi:hypothetical protein